MKSQQKLTTEEAEFIKANKQHFDLVLKANQHFQRSHDIASKVIAIHERIIGPVDYCNSCEDEAHARVLELLKSEK